MHEAPILGNPLPGRPVVFGEILFDHFPGGRAVLGGAPFNVAWHLHGFGHEPLMVSRIGRDAPGEEIRRRMADWGLSTEALETDDTHPTGRVTVEIEHGEPRFRIESHQAYDRIDGCAARTSGKLEDAALVYHGSLALREEVSRNALTKLQTACGAPAFVDINLRSPWWTPARAHAGLDHAAWAKLNADELATLAGADCATEDSAAAAAATLADVHGIGYVIVTRGADGALVHGEGRVLAHGPAAPVAALVDAVGAGDAFAAVTLLGILEGWPPVTTLTRAARFAAEICGRRGAIPESRDLYEAHRQAWKGGHE